MDSTKPRPGEPGYAAHEMARRSDVEKRRKNAAKMLALRSVRTRQDRAVLDGDDESVYAPTGQDTVLEDLRGETVREVTGIRACPWDHLR